MSDPPFYAPTRFAAARQPRVAEPLWAVQKEGRQLACELRDDGAFGVDVQVYRDGELLYGHRWPTRALALEKAADWKAQYLLAGAVIIS